MNLLNTPEGQDLLKIQGRIYKVTPNSVHVIKDVLKDRIVIEAVFYNDNWIEKLLSPIQEKMNIARDAGYVKDEYEAFKHYAGYERHFLPQIFLTTGTFNPATGANSPVNGEAQRTAVSESWATLYSGAGNSAQIDASGAPCAELQASNTSNQFSTLTRGIFLFDTSSLGEGAIISDAVFSLYVASKTDNLTLGVGITASSPAASNTISNSDYNIANFGSTLFATSKGITPDITTSAYNNWTFNAAGIASIAKAGISKYGTRIDKDIANLTPTWIIGAASKIIAQYASEANKPKLVVTYEVQGGFLAFL